MSLINLIRNLGSDEKTRLLGEETTRILRYTFSKSDTDAVPLHIIDEAVAAKEGTNLVYKNKYRETLIESLKSSTIASLGFENYSDAIKTYSKNVEKFITDFNIEEEYRLKKIVDERKNYEYSVPIYGQCNGTHAFPHFYQLRLKDLILKNIWSNIHSSILTTMPTGAGKTVLAMEVLIDLFRSFRPGGRENLQVGWFVDSKELCEQSFQSFQKLWKQKGDRKVMAQRYFDKFKNLELRSENKITFGAFTLLSERIRNIEVKQFLSQTDLIIIDEAHGANAFTYKNVLMEYKKNNPRGQIIGLTATPFRNDDSDYKTLKGMFQSYFEIEDEEGGKVESPIEFLIKRKYLSRVNFQILNAEGSRNSQSEYYTELHKSILQECRNIISKKENTIIFAQSMPHAIALNIYLKNNGVQNELIVGSTPPVKRKKYLKNFGSKKDSLSVIVNHQILSTGIDVPGMNSIMVLSKINSPSLALQVIGRAMRGELNGGNSNNTIYLTKDNYNTLREFKILEDKVLH